MHLTTDLSQKIIEVACGYFGVQYLWGRFDCVTFVREVYRQVNINLPILDRTLPPPTDFHLRAEEVESENSIGHSIFLRRKLSQTNRVWTHLVIISPNKTMIHCSRQVGRVIITPHQEMLERYSIATI